MDAAARDALERAEKLARLERAADLLAQEQPVPRRDVRALLGAALALLLAFYPAMSAAAQLTI